MGLATAPEPTLQSDPAIAGIGLRPEHSRDVLIQKPAIGWFEVHSENYFGQGGMHLSYLERIRNDYPVSLHGVGLSIGSTDPFDSAHLRKLKTLIERLEPVFVSEHLSWASVDGYFFNDLLPLPYTQQSLNHMVSRVGQVQDFLGRRILIENISSYLQFRDSDIPEWEFIAELSRRSGCGILLDINNIYVNAINHGFDPCDFIRAIPAARVLEIHLAGHTCKSHGSGKLLIDTHDHPVADAVWALYNFAMCSLGIIPTLIEWDTDLPPLDILLGEARRAKLIMDKCDALAA